MNYYPHNIGDYIKDTAHLDPLEDGIYRRMLDLYYSTEAPLPDDMAWLCKRLRVSQEAHGGIVRELLRDFFKTTKQGYRHSRCDIEIGKAQEKRKKAAESAGVRWHKDADANALRTHCEGNATPNSEGNAPNPNPNPNPNPKEKTTRRKASLPVPVDWKPNPGTAQRAAMEFSLQAQQVEAYRVAFLDICAAKGYMYANIDAAFINCIRKDWPGLRTQNGKPAPVVDLEAKRKADALAALDPDARLEAIRRDFAERNAGMSGVNLRAMP